ncbi:MAG: bifunctional riboflavin kinase/FAD synthetase [Bdellovibrionales bacterium]|nr:bifunctional riboflavin kinase/FAD synthetase [Bdellovibrionales bacterium]
MKVIELRTGKSFNKAPFDQCVVTIGNFDGVHRGHQELLRLACDQAQKKKIASVALTFWPHPQEVLLGEDFQRLFGQEELIDKFARLGVEYLVIVNFTKELSQILPEEFYQDYLVKPLNPRTIVVGYNFRFGSKGAGDIKLLKALGEEESRQVLIVEPFRVNDQVVSSSEIKLLLASGNLSYANELLGDEYFICGQVQRGQEKGRELGFPTLNLYPQHVIVPQRGVYITTVEHSGKSYPSITNIGIRPTFYSNGQEVVESHLLNENPNWYGQSIKVNFLEFLRSEKKFNGVDELLSQIHIDVKLASEYFRKYEMGSFS